MEPMKNLVFSLATLIALSLPASLVTADQSAQTQSAPAPEQPYVRADVQQYLDNLRANPRPQLTRQMLEMIRQMPPEKMQSTSDLPVGDLAVIKDFTMPGPSGDLKLRLYDARAQREAGPVVVFFHGGAYIVGSIDTHAGLTAEMARQLDLPVVSVEYRLAPENPWPAAVDDGEAAARWIAENGKVLQREFTGLIISGDSAGGNLTLVTVQALRDKPAALPVVMQLPIYPATDNTQTYPSGQQFNRGYGLDISEDDEDFYAADPHSVRASPLLADLQGMPPTVMVTASLDPLRDQGRAYAVKLVEAGVSTVYYEAKGNIHGFATYRQAIPSSQQDLTAFLAAAKAMLQNLSEAQTD